MTMQQMVWLFFSFSGRIDRSVYALASLFVLTVQAFIVYRYLQPLLGTLATGAFDPAELLAQTPMSRVQSGLFLLGQLVHISLAVKRIHDFGKSGFFGILFLFGGIFVFIALCLIPGGRGPNRYGQQSNAPK